MANAGEVVESRCGRSVRDGITPAVAPGEASAGRASSLRDLVTACSCARTNEGAGRSGRYTTVSVPSRTGRSGCTNLPDAAEASATRTRGNSLCVWFLTWSRLMPLFTMVLLFPTM